MRVDRLRASDSAWLAAELDFRRRRIPLPLVHTAVWAEHRPLEHWIWAVHDVGGRIRGGFSSEIGRSRSLPGHLLLRVRRVGHGLDLPVAAAALEAVADHVRRNRRFLKANVELFALDGTHRRALQGVLARLGFRAAESKRSYSHTLLVDLRPGEAEILASLPASRRRHIRGIARRNLELRPLGSEHLSRLQGIYVETLHRTGGHANPSRVGELLGIASAAPDRCRGVGLFRRDVDGPEALVAFAFACLHGDHAQYDCAGSDRTFHGTVSYADALLWDLMTWAKSHGAEWFDLGGIDPRDRDPRRRGIAEFKRHYSDLVAEVGDEWVLEPAPRKARLARAISAVAGGVRRLWT